MAAEQSGLSPFVGSADLSKNLGINSCNPFNLPQYPPPYVAHFYPVINPQKTHRGFPPTSAFSPPNAESILQSVAAGRADFLRNELYKNLLNSTTRFDPKPLIKRENFPVGSPFQYTRALDGKLGNISGHPLHRNQLRAFYEDLRRKLVPRDALLRPNSNFIDHRGGSDLSSQDSPAWQNSISKRSNPFASLPPSSSNNKVHPPELKNRFPQDFSSVSPPKNLSTPRRDLSPAVESDVTMKKRIDNGCSPTLNESSASLKSDDNVALAADRLKRKRRFTSSTGTCPVCGVTIRQSEVKQHFLLESSKLDRISVEVYKNSKRNTICRKSTGGSVKSSEYFVQATTSNKKREDTDNEKISTRKLNRQKTFEKVRSNRVERFNSRVGQCRDFTGNWNSCPPAFKEKMEGVVCPVCNKLLSHLNSHEELADHVMACSDIENRERDAEDGDSGLVDVDGGDFQEYEWCGETRIRATAIARRELLEGLPGYLVMKRSDEEPELELDVESDETRDYGSAQFQESDLLQSASSDEETAADEKHTIEDKSVISNRSSTSPPIDCENISGRLSPTLVTQALKMKIHDLQSTQQSNRCLICMNSYSSPLVSIQCWHVHCKRCWLRALGVKKLCPQCNMITPASQLRRIYL